MNENMYRKAYLKGSKLNLFISTSENLDFSTASQINFLHNTDSNLKMLYFFNGQVKYIILEIECLLYFKHQKFALF